MPFRATVFSFALVFACGVSRAAAQEPPLPVEEALAVFAAEARGEPVTERPWVQIVVLQPEDFSPEYVTAILDGLEEMATEESAGRAQGTAVIWLSTPGRTSGSDPMPGIVARLERIYDRSTSGLQKEVVIQALTHQAESDAAIELLTRIARSGEAAEGTDHMPIYNRAINALAEAHGDAGRAALRALYESGSVDDPGVRSRLEWLAERDFRLRPGGGWKGHATLTWAAHPSRGSGAQDRAPAAPPR